MPSVKGQKWGFRQYQYPDGTWTELGKERRRIGGERTKRADISHSFGFRTSESLMHHGIKGQEWGVRNGPPYPLQRPSTDISDKNYAKIEELYQSMSLQDRSWIDPDNPEKPYFSSKKNYYESVAFNAVSKHGFIVAEKIPEDQNVDQTHGVEVGIGVTKKGKGVGSGLTKDLTDWFDSQDDYDVIWWPVDERNGASIRIAEKNGFIKDPLGDNYIYAKDSAYKKLGIESS